MSLLSLPPHIDLIKTRFGAVFILTTDNTVGQALIDYGEWCFSEIELLQSFLRPGDNIIDVGANIGTHTIPLSRIVGPQGRVVSFEPQPLIFQILSANALINGVENIDLMHAACASARGSITFADIDYRQRDGYAAISLSNMQASENDARTASRQPVPVLPIDDVFARDGLRLIKIDVEGMEQDVLRGAARTIRRFRPIIYIENENPETSEALLRLIEQYGYRSFWHVVPLYSARNYNENAKNLYGSACCINNLCIPKEMTSDLPGLAAVGDFSEHPRKRAATNAKVLHEKAAVALCRQSLALEHQGRLEDALALCSRALTIDPQCASAFVQSGDILRKLGRLSDAIEHYRSAFAADPDNQKARLALKEIE